MSLTRTTHLANYPAVRRMTADDLPAVLTVQAACYVDVPLEDESVFRVRLQTPDTFSWVAVNQGRIGGYLMAYQSRRGLLTALGATFSPDADGDTLYLHDLAIHPDCKGTGMGWLLVSHALQTGSEIGLQHAALVSVQNSGPYWQKHDFHPYQELEPHQAQKLLSYEPEALYRVRSLRCSTDENNRR